MKETGLEEARFKRRLNRFLVEVEMGGEVVHSYLPNPGRLKELLTTGAVLYLRQRASDSRKTRYDTVAVLYGSTVVSLDSRLPNSAVRRRLEKGRLKEFRQYCSVRPEVRLGNSRVDFLLSNGHECYLEVKSCTLVVDGVALFPDAPTERGRRHLGELAGAVESGVKGAVLFVVQRPDAELFRPNDGTDPAFGEALRQAHDSGVEVYAYRSRFDGRDLAGFEPIQTSLGAG